MYNKVVGPNGCIHIMDEKIFKHQVNSLRMFYPTSLPSEAWDDFLARGRFEMKVDGVLNEYIRMNDDGSLPEKVQ